MIIEKKLQYIKKLQQILIYIGYDKPSAAIKFEKELDKKILLLIKSPEMCTKSYYFNNDNYRDLIYQGYTVIYKIEKEKILILEIFKWQNR